MKTLLILGTILLSANAFAGNEKGNGGGVHYCAQNKQIELYDIYEAQARYNYEIRASLLPLDTQVKTAIAKITKANPYVGRLVAENIAYLNNKHTIIRLKAKLTPIGDAKILVTDEDCSYEQLANWDEVSGNLIVKKEYFDRMNSFNQAAFFIHETLYKVARDLDLLEKNVDGSTNSDEIRRMVGEIFSTNEKLSLLWTVEDPQVIAERKKAEAEAERVRQEAASKAVDKEIKGIIEACSQAVLKTNQVQERFLKDLANTKEEFESYFLIYSKSLETCRLSKDSVYISPDFLNSIFFNERYSVHVYYREKYGPAYDTINDMIKNLSASHEKFMNIIMKSNL